MGVMGFLHSVRENLQPSDQSMISYKMLTIVLLVFISHRSLNVDAVPLPERMLDEGRYLIIPIGGGQTFYDNDFQDLTVGQDDLMRSVNINVLCKDGMFSRTQRGGGGGGPPSQPDPVATRHIRGIKSPYDRAALRTIGG